MNNGIKLIIAAALAAVGMYFKQLMIPFAVAVLVMALDWISGVIAAGIAGEVCSRTGIVGILKKVGYAFVIVVGCVVDFVVQFAADKLGIAAGGFYYFGLLVTMWIIVNELISILENVVRIGVPVPKFLERVVQTLKIKTENKGEMLAEDAAKEDEGDGTEGN